MKTREERRAARVLVEEKKRRAAGERAFHAWVRASRSKPLPVPLNQGELNLHNPEARHGKAVNITSRCHA
ncbi:hypothetical protein EVAR_20956_1 [Eumeta japonica]|uniref:Uncharacterized protein n=1 Tax=Eumeta variegata TaxID=151549 RepID=A0A4C1V7X8_EUMVA|nr:hypothetical protein EVAR_20956_1 [Eumeta japonica]